MQDLARLAEDVGEAKLKHAFNDVGGPWEYDDAYSELNKQVQGNLLPSPGLIMEPFIDLPEANYQQLCLYYLYLHLS